MKIILNEEFKTHGIYAISNSLGLEVEISNDGSSARCRHTNSNNVVEISDWSEILYNEIGEPYFLCDGMEIEMGLVTRLLNA